MDAVSEKHFKAMSLIHALGWRDSYVGYVPQDYLDNEITDDRWVAVFRKNYEEQTGVHGLLLYRGDTPVSCINYCKARTENYNPGDVCKFDKAGGFQNVFVFVLRENEKARKFYAAHGFSWDGTHQDIPFPPNAICVDLRYVKSL